MAKYVAAGFFLDAEKLLTDFVHENSFDFSVFAQLWKKHNFAAVYLGRDAPQIACFTNEIFQVTLGFLSNTSFLFQVGVFYLLYALYRHQIYTPFVKIRITLSQFEKFKKIQSTALKNKFYTLHFVADYLYEHSFDFVALSTLYGPRSSRTKIDYSNTAFTSSSLIKEIKCEMKKLHDSKTLEELRDLNSQYLTLRQKASVRRVKRNPFQDYEEQIKQLHNLVSDGPMKPSKRYTKMETSVGSRRLAIKSAAFSNKALFRQLNESEDDELERKSPESVPKNQKRKRLLKEKRKPGRPRKDSKPFKKSSKTRKNSAGEESPIKDSRGKKKRITFLDDYNIEPELKPIKFEKTKSSYSDLDSDSEDEDAALREIESYDSEEIEQSEHH